MATYLGTAAVFEVRSAATAGNLGGGGFNPANANFISNFTATSATGNSPVISSASYNFVAGDVGAWIYVKSGTNWTPGWYQISSVASNNATVNATIGAAIQVSNNRFVTNTVAGCATTASPTAGNCGIDYSQQNSAQVTNNVLTGTTTTCTDATTPFGAQHVGNFICISAGTGVTAGWYEIVSVSGVTATLDRTAGTSYSGCTYYLGGAVSLGGSTAGITDAIFIQLGAAASTTGSRYFIKGNATYTPSSSIVSLVGNASWPCIVEGYNAVRGDRPSIASGNQPLFSMAAFTFTAGDFSQVWCLNFTGTASPVVAAATASGFSFFVYCKCKNTSTSAAQHAFNAAFTNCQFIGCEAISYNGNGLRSAGGANVFIGCYAHDSNVPIAIPSVGNAIINCIISGGTTDNITANANGNIIYGNTIYGAENKTGDGLENIGASCSIINNIIYGFVNGFGGSVTRLAGVQDYNCYFNNTTNINAGVVGSYLGANDVTATNPSFTSVAQVTGTTATSSGTTLTDSGKNFTTAGVVAGRDYLYVISGTGATAGIYGITAVGTTTLTTDNSLGTISGSGTYQITTGRNFLPTGAI